MVLGVADGMCSGFVGEADDKRVKRRLFIGVGDITRWRLLTDLRDLMEEIAWR